MKVIIAGELPLAEDLLHRCVEAGHETALCLAETLADAAAVQRLRRESASADVAVECHNESKSAKRGLVEWLDGAPLLVVSALACSTTEAASWTAHPGNAVGWAALPPLEAGGAVEIARGLATSDEAASAARAFWQGLGVEVVEVADGPGLVRARILCAIVNEAAGALMDGIASAADIDLAMRLGANYPHGPLAWGDAIGLDLVLGVMRGLYEEYGEDRYRPSPLLSRHVQAGWLGRKTGRGFYQYSG